MTVVQQLYQLQEIDLALEKKKTGLAALQARMGETEALRSARQALAEAKDEQARLQREQRGLEADVQDLTDKVQKLEKKLYEGSVKSPKELSNMQEELERFKARRSEMEEKQLALMSAVEKAGAAIEARSRETAAAEEAWRTEQAGLLKDQEQLQSEIAVLTLKRQAAAGAVLAPDLALYEDVRAQRQGQAVARLSSRLCLGCRITVPDADYRRAMRGNEIVRCPNCRRILYNG